MRQIHIPWCTLTQTIRDISTLAWAGIVKKLPVLSSREFMLLMYDALSQISSVYKFPSLVVRQSGTQIRILTAHISSVYKNTSLGSRQSEPQTRKVDYPSRKSILGALKVEIDFNFFSGLTKHVENVFFAKNGISFGQVLPREHHL